MESLQLKSKFSSILWLLNLVGDTQRASHVVRPPDLMSENKQAKPYLVDECRPYPNILTMLILTQEKSPRLSPQVLH